MLSLEISETSLEKSVDFRPLLEILNTNKAAFNKTRIKKMVKKVVIYRISLKV